ncbi:MAG: protease inhibitor I42 family protein [Bacteroidales bacterium]|jgi:predicted secreted protein
MGQKYISSDTVITQKIKSGTSFELKFVNLPGAGYIWQADSVYDKSIITIKDVSSVVMEGNATGGGHFINTIEFIGKKQGSTIIEYFYKRPWLKEWLYKCQIKIEVE